MDAGANRSDLNMRQIYATITEEVTKRLFRVQIPEYYRYHPIKRAPGDVSPPLYEPTDRFEMALSSLPLTHIVDMCVNKVEFRVMDPKDITTIVEILLNYQHHIEQLPEGSLDDDTRIFFDRVKQAIAIIGPRAVARRNYEVHTHGEKAMEPDRLFKLMAQAQKAIPEGLR